MHLFRVKLRPAVGRTLQHSHLGRHTRGEQLDIQRPNKLRPNISTEDQTT
jgi:hypothetical protein